MLIQKLEKEKITSVEYKHQISEKEKFYQRVTSELEKSNETLSINFEEVTSKANKFENSYKAKCSDHDHLQKNF